jgi:hypothetical protein
MKTGAKVLPISGFFSLLTRDRGGSLERLHRPNRFRDWLHAFQGENQGPRFLRALMPFAIKAGLMKPRKGFTLVTGKEKLGMGKGKRLVDTKDKDGV